MKRLFAIVLSMLLIPRLFVSADETSPAPHTYSSVLTEARTGMVIGGTDSDLPLPIGTLTKLMTVYLTAEAVAEGRLTPDQTISVSPAAEGYPGATVWLRGGEKMRVTDLLKAVIIGNANDACIALAYHLSGSEENFVMEMNAAAFSLGMRQTRFADCTGISDENIGTAADLALLCRALTAYDWLTPVFGTWRDFLRDGETELVSENTLTRTYDGIRGMKAGHGDASGYTVCIAAQREQLCMIAVVLGCDDENERFTYAKNLLETGFSSYYVTTPDFSAEFMQPIAVRRGTANAVMPETGELLSIAAPKDERISSVVVLPAYLEAPVYKGQQIGTAAFYCGDSLLYETPITAAEAVPRRGFRETLKKLFLSLF